jgi:hypothetical protein
MFSEWPGILAAMRIPADRALAVLPSIDIFNTCELDYI